MSRSGGRSARQSVQTYPQNETLRIGRLELELPVVLAPMAGVTNPPFRRLCRNFGAGLYVSEMITARGLVEGGRKTQKLAQFAPDESPRSIQLYGTDPTSIGGAVAQLVGEGRVDHVDLNFGCPAKKITRHGGGAALPAKLGLYRQVVAAAVDAAGAVPVTVKFRSGLRDDVLTYLDAGRVAEEEGVAAVALHARTAEQLYSGRADWDAIARLKQHVTSIPVLGNGDIWEAADAIRMMAETGCDGVVVGRGCLGRPWLFRDLALGFGGGEPDPAPRLGRVIDVMLEHARLHSEWFGERGLRDFRKHTSWYLKGYPIGGEARQRFQRIGTIDDLERETSTLDRNAELPANALRMPRGHTGGPRRVTLPEGWLDDTDATATAHAHADTLVSGG